MALAIAIVACHPHPPSLIPVPMAKADWQPVTRYLDSALAGGAAPGAVLGVSRGGERFVYGAGQLGADEPVRPGPQTIYDLASLTKVVGLTTAAMLAVEDGKLDLDAPVQRYVPGFGGPGKDRVTVRMLLAHASGLPEWRPLFRKATTRAEVFALADSTPLDVEPGRRETYSDIGAIVLTQAIETVFGQRLDSLLQRRVFQPQGMTATGYLPPAGWRERIAPTEMDPWRGRVLRGEVHDENAAMMDGVSGHAGLFSSAEDLLTFAEWILKQGDGPILREFTRRQNLVPGSTRALGWDTPSPEGSSAGSRLSPRSFGHTGFTGTSLWIDPERHLVIVLLSNRVNPTRNNPRWAPVRGQLADLIMATLTEDPR
jgi:CubicO group peptidase (beta-lactamase class C family)